MSYSLITGASSGIGADIARQLALTGTNLILVARRIDRLEQLAQELRESFDLDVKIIQADLIKEEQIDQVVELANSVEIKWLVNNAGFGDISQFEDSDFAKIMSMVQVNVNALTFLTHRLLPNLKRNKGHIVNIASMASFFPGPGMAVYYASKHYVLALSEALYQELRNKVYVTTVCPGPVNTEFMDVAAPGSTGFFGASWVPGPAQVAEKTIRQAKKGKAFVFFGFMYHLALFFSRFVPRRLLSRIMTKVQLAKMSK